MTNLLRTGSNFLGDKLKAFASSEITYKRAASSVTLLAHFGRTEFDVDAEFDIARETFESRDFIVEAVDLDFGAGQIDPVEGDRVEWVDGGSTYTFEVVLPPSSPPWRWADPFHKRKRIHTRLTGIVAT